MTGRNAHRTATLTLSLLMGAIGLALIVQALSASGVASTRLVLGVLFVAAATGRIYIELRRGRGR